MTLVDELTTSKTEADAVTELLRSPRRTFLTLPSTKLQSRVGSLEEVLDVKRVKIIVLKFHERAMLHVLLNPKD